MNVGELDFLEGEGGVYGVEGSRMSSMRDPNLESAAPRFYCMGLCMTLSVRSIFYEVDWAELGSTESIGSRATSTSNVCFLLPLPTLILGFFRTGAGVEFDLSLVVILKSGFCIGAYSKFTSFITDSSSKLPMSSSRFSIVISYPTWCFVSPTSSNYCAYSALVTFLSIAVTSELISDLGKLTEYLTPLTSNV